MGGKARALTDIAIQNLRPGETRREVPDPGAKGLYIIIQPTGARGYAVRYRFNGQPRKLTLKSGITLAAARKATADALYDVQQGKDPAAHKIAEKRAQRSAMSTTLRAVCEEYFRRDGKRLRSKDQIEASLERLVYSAKIEGKSELGERQIDSIRRSEVVKLLDKIEDDSGPVMADRVLAYIRKIMNWHATRTDDFRSPIVRGMARTKPKERARKRILTDEELRDVWKALESANVPACYPRYIKSLLLLATRRNESADMSSGEIDGDLWTIPGERYKTKLDHVIPLTEQAKALIGAKPEGFKGNSWFVFSNTDGNLPFGGFSKAKRELDAELAKIRKADGRPAMPRWTLHDLRRTARSLMSRAGVAADIAERCLGHVIGGVRETYDRYEYADEKRAAFAALATLIDRIINPEDNVTPIMGRA